MSLAAAQHLMKALDANQGTTPVRDLLPAMIIKRPMKHKRRLISFG